MGVADKAESVVNRDGELASTFLFDAPIKTFAGEPLRQVDQFGKETGVLTFREACLRLLGNAVAENADDCGKCFRLGVKMATANDISELSTEERALMLKKVKENKIQFVTLIQGFLISVLE